MSGARTSPMYRMVAVTLIALLSTAYSSLEAMAAEAYPVAPTIRDTHQYFESLVGSSGVVALYEIKSRNGDILGYESFPVLTYRGVVCHSAIALKNGVAIDINWAIVEQAQFSDGGMSILHEKNMQFTSFHMVMAEGGLVVEPANPIPRLIFGINDALSRNRLFKAIDLLSSV